MLDFGDAFYDPLDEEAVVGLAHPSSNPWTAALVRVRLRDGSVTGIESTGLRWGCGDLNPYPEEGILLTTYCSEGVVDVRDLATLKLRRRLRLVDVGRAYSAVLDSSGEIIVLGGRGVYRVSDEEGVVRARKVLNVSGGVSMDSQRAVPSRIIALANYLRHEILVLGEDMGVKGLIPSPYPGGVRFSEDERLIVSSGRFPKHVQLTLVYGATHVGWGSGWFAYLWDYGTIASNRACLKGFESVLIQWSLSLIEAPYPLPKFKPFTTYLGSGVGGNYLSAEGFKAPTPAPALGECYLITSGSGRVTIERLATKHSVLAPQDRVRWLPFSDAEVGSLAEVRVPGLYRVKVVEGVVENASLVCRPANPL